MSETRKMKVLIADDERLSRRLIAGTLAKDFELLEVEDGQQAVDAFEAFRPDVVLLDVEMPRLNGVETARALKALAGTRFVPIFLISGLEEQPTLIRGLAAGADDFLPKPFNAAVFKPKLEVFLRLQDMQRRLVAQNAALEAFQQETRAEHRVAVQVFERLLARGAMADPRLRVVLSPLSVFNGDVVLASMMKSGAFRLLAADVSGHGLTGALGTLPLMTLFHATTDREDSLSSCAQQLNAELKAMLPPQLFCSAVLMELDRDRGLLQVINCGMPEVIISGASLRTYPSRNVPLGITRTWTPELETVEVSQGERLFVMSDGVVERTNALGELFGSERVRAVLAESGDGFARLQEAVSRFSGEQSDDLSLIEVQV